MWRNVSVVVVGMLALAGCSSTGTGGGGTGTTAPPDSAAMTTAATAPPTSAAAMDTATPTTEATAQGVAVTVDPCAVYPQGEASSLSGVTLQAGNPQTYDQGSKGCFYSGGTEGVTGITIAQGTSAADANAVWTQEETKAQQELQAGLPSGVTFTPTLTDVTGIGDRASLASFSGSIGPVTLSGGAIYVLKGATFFSVSVIRLSGTAPTADAFKAEATTILGRL